MEIPDHTTVKEIIADAVMDIISDHALQISEIHIHWHPRMMGGPEEIGDLMGAIEITAKALTVFNEESEYAE